MNQVYRQQHKQNPSHSLLISTLMKMLWRPFRAQMQKTYCQTLPSHARYSKAHSTSHLGQCSLHTTAPFHFVDDDCACQTQIQSCPLQLIKCCQGRTAENKSHMFRAFLSEAIPHGRMPFPFKIFMHDQAITNQLFFEPQGFNGLYVCNDNSMHRACPFLNTNNSRSCGSRNHHTISFTLISVM